MCEYCEGYSVPISFPIKIVYSNDEEEIIQYGFQIVNKKEISFFEKKMNTTNKEILFNRDINFCPFCGKELEDTYG